MIFVNVAYLCLKPINEASNQELHGNLIVLEMDAMHYRNRELVAADLMQAGLSRQGT